MSQLNFHRINSVPAVLQNGSVYFKKKDASKADLFITGSDGTRYDVVNDALIDDRIQLALANVNQVEYAADIATRDALNLSSNAIAFVQDASADSHVNAGSAFYFYEKGSSTWFMISEFESMNLSLTWDAIQGKPNSSPAEIDTTVQQSHTHNNSSVLSELGEDNATGHLTYKGSLLNTWSREEF